MARRSLAGPSRRWCRELWSARAALNNLLSSGLQLTDPRMLALSRRLDRLAVEAIRSGMDTRSAHQAAPSAAGRVG